MAFTKTAGVNYGTPDLTLTTSNASGSNQVAIRNDASVLVYDATVPEVIAVAAGSSSAGDTAVAARRNHVHGHSAFTSDISVKVYADAAQEIADDTTTTLTFNQETFKTVDGMHSNSQDNERLISPSDGKYLVLGQVEWQDSTSGSRWMQIVDQAGATVTTVGCATVTATSFTMGQTIAALVDIDEDDWVSLIVRQNSGGALDTGTPRTTFAMMKIASP